MESMGQMEEMEIAMVLELYIIGAEEEEGVEHRERMAGY